MGFSWRGGVSRGVHGVIWGWQPEELLSLPGVPISIPGRTWVNPSSSSSIPTAPLPSGKPQTVLDLHGLSKALSMRMLDLNSKTVIFESQPTPSHLCPTSNGILERPQIADGNCVAGRLCFNSTSIRWDMKKRNIQEAFLAAEFLGGGKYKPWDSGMSWEQPRWLSPGPAWANWLPANLPQPPWDLWLCSRGFLCPGICCC